jgi:hypothetical protein
MSHGLVGAASTCCWGLLCALSLLLWVMLGRLLRNVAAGLHLYGVVMAFGARKPAA